VDSPVVVQSPSPTVKLSPRLLKPLLPLLQDENQENEDRNRRKANVFVMQAKRLASSVTLVSEETSPQATLRIPQQPNLCRKPVQMSYVELKPEVINDDLVSIGIVPKPRDLKP
jgi:hypothetical protein